MLINLALVTKKTCLLKIKSCIFIDVRKQKICLDHCGCQKLTKDFCGYFIFGKPNSCEFHQSFKTDFSICILQQIQSNLLFRRKFDEMSRMLELRLQAMLHLLNVQKIPSMANQPEQLLCREVLKNSGHHILLLIFQKMTSTQMPYHKTKPCFNDFPQAL